MADNITELPRAAAWNVDYILAAHHSVDAGLDAESAFQRFFQKFHFEAREGMRVDSERVAVSAAMSV
ncbi:MAG: hypothetical protein RMM10_12560, partial [Anaerolineae bacterium]